MLPFSMLVLRKQGLYCEAGDFYIDPKGAVARALVTHAHSDHARRGAERYHTARSGVGLLRTRLGQGIRVEGHAFGERFALGAVTVSFHPAGHILGSAQVRLERDGEVWVVSGDYKREPDPTCEPFESVPCHVFVTEATFGTPAYRWEGSGDVGRDIFTWWEKNRAKGRNSLLYAYSLGKTQRVLALLRKFTGRPAYLDPSALAFTECYRQEGVELLPVTGLREASHLEGELVLAPPSFLSGPYAHLVGDRFEAAFASGWAAGGRWASGEEQGFVLSDHADWAGLLRTILESGARRVYVQHRGQGALVRHLRELGLEAFPEEELARRGAPSAQLALFGGGGRGRVEPNA